MAEQAAAGRWVSTTDYLPVPDRLVRVHGPYTPDEGPWPMAWVDPRPAYRRDFGLWASEEWRGLMVHWWWDEADKGCGDA